jgi:hypothetical protein
MKTKLLLAAAVLAVATIGPLAAVAAPGYDVPIAEERKAQSPAVDQVTGAASPGPAVCSVIRVSSDLYKIAPARPVQICVPVTLRVAAAAGEVRELEPVAYPLLL